MSLVFFLFLFIYATFALSNIYIVAIEDKTQNIVPGQSKVGCTKQDENTEVC